MGRRGPLYIGFNFDRGRLDGAAGDYGGLRGPFLNVDVDFGQGTMGNQWVPYMPLSTLDGRLRGVRESLISRIYLWMGHNGGLRDPLYVDCKSGRGAMGDYGLPYMTIFTLDDGGVRAILDVDLNVGRGTTASLIRRI